MLGKTMGKWLPMMAAGLIFLSGCAPVVKENGKTMAKTSYFLVIFDIPCII